MKKVYISLIAICFIVVSAIIILNIDTTTSKCINYKCQNIKIPLCLKIIDFFDRDYNYKNLVKMIIKDQKNNEEKVMMIFRWTYENIRRVPKDMPIIDDHVWNIIIRGYGESDQSSDVFTTLCNYAGFKAFFYRIAASSQAKKIPFVFVFIDNKWYIFDSYNGAYFKDRNGRLIDIESLKAVEIMKPNFLDKEFPIDYCEYVRSVPHITKMKLSRSNIQTPARRLFYEIKKVLGLLSI